MIILDVFVLRTQRQNNGTDCGCHAVATAVEFLHEDADPTADFAVERTLSTLATMVADFGDNLSHNTATCFFNCLSLNTNVPILFL